MTGFFEAFGPLRGVEVSYGGDSRDGVGWYWQSRHDSKEVGFVTCEETDGGTAKTFTSRPKRNVELKARLLGSGTSLVSVV